jgi:hypothetical protein
MYDLTLTYPDGRKAAAEVVSTRDRRAMALFVASQRRGYTQDDRLSRGWCVRVEESARLNEVAAKIVPLLQQLERAGVEHADAHFGFGCHVDLDSAQVVSCWSFGQTTKHPPGFYLWPPTNGAWVGDGENIVREVGEFLPTAPDVAAKLAHSGLSERHAVLVVTVDRFALFASLDCGALPVSRPHLPAGVDCLWLVTMKSPPIRVVYWLADGAWRDATLTKADLGMPALLAP